jgi:hypothetical protein
MANSVIVGSGLGFRANGRNRSREPDIPGQAADTRGHFDSGGQIMDRAGKLPGSCNNVKPEERGAAARREVLCRVPSWPIHLGALAPEREEIDLLSQRRPPARISWLV